MEKQQNKIPLIRFPQFKEKWEVKRLGELGKLVSGLTYSPKNIDKKGVLVLRSSNVKNRNLKLDDTVYVKVEKYNPVKLNDILICVRNGSKRLIGKNALIDERVAGVAFGAFMTIYRSDFNSFLFQWLDTDAYKRNVYRNLGATINSINNNDLKEFKLHVPTLPEQKKIAHFFSIVDQKLNQLQEKKTALELYKKGMMQQIFSQQLRFKDDNGQDFPEWIVKKLGEVCEFAKGKSISKKDIVENGETECIRYGELYTHYNEVISEIISKTNINPKNLIFSKANDVIIPASGEDRLDIATASCIINSGIAIGGDLNIIRSNNNGIFLSYYLNSIKKREIANLAQGVSVVHLYSSQLSLLSINIPVVKEQTKIANFLSKIDDKINAVTEQIEQTKEYKKGLLQKMFV